MSAVDLGLSVKWANMNLGAEKPEDFGKFYILENSQSYDTVPRDTELPDNWHERYDSLGVFLLEYDTACILTNQEWRIPTMKEWVELGEKCTWKWACYKGTEGYHIKGPNGNSIFLPAAGHTESKYGDVLNGFYRISHVWDGGASFSVSFKKPKDSKSPIISLEEWEIIMGDVAFESYGCHVPASIRAVKVEQSNTTK